MSQLDVKLFKILCAEGMNKIDYYTGFLEKILCTNRIKEIDLLPDKPVVSDIVRDFTFCPV